MSGRLVHTGQVIVDVVMRVPAVPAAGGDVMATGTELLAGGGFNVMAAAARSGARVLYAGAHGAGAFGDQVRAALRAEGIEIAHAPSDDPDTGFCVALVDASGERTFVTGTGAAGRLLPERLARLTVGEDDLVYITGYSLLDASNREALLGWLPGLAGARVLLDPGPLIGDVPAVALAEVLARVDVLSCSAAEARTLTGVGMSAGARASAEGGDARSAAMALAARLRPDAAVIVRDGPAGCVLVRDRQVQSIPGFPVCPVDTNGAGDTHCGVLAATLLDGTDLDGTDLDGTDLDGTDLDGTDLASTGLDGTALEAAAVRANAAAAISVTRQGPATAPTRAELDAFLATHT